MYDTSDKNNNSNVSCSKNGLKNRGTIENNNCKNVESVDTDFVIYKPKIRWPDLAAQLFLHIGAIYGLVTQFYAIKLFTFVWCEYYI